jgi:hypothetical protein
MMPMRLTVGALLNVYKSNLRVQSQSIILQATAIPTVHGAGF